MNEKQESPKRPLTPEEIILWLDGHRQMMWEVWTHNPELRKRWEKINLSEPEKKKS